MIEEGKIREIRELIEKGRHTGMQTFDQCLLDLYTQGAITEEVAIAESDSPSNLRLQISHHKGLNRPGGKELHLKRSGSTIHQAPILTPRTSDF